MSTVEAAAILEVGVATVNRWADRGILPTAVKAPGKRGARMFDLATVKDLKLSRAVSA